MRQYLTGSKKWFDLEAAQCWVEVYTDIPAYSLPYSESKIVGMRGAALGKLSDTRTELYFTASGLHILHTWEGTVHNWQEIDREQAAEWKSKSNHMPEDVARLILNGGS